MIHNPKQLSLSILIAQETDTRFKAELWTYFICAVCIRWCLSVGYFTFADVSSKSHLFHIFNAFSTMSEYVRLFYSRNADWIGSG